MSEGFNGIRFWSIPQKIKPDSLSEPSSARQLSTGVFGGKRSGIRMLWSESKLNEKDRSRKGERIIQLNTGSVEVGSVCVCACVFRRIINIEAFMWPSGM